jgi:predicted metallo-beta-lactamase superfamily hydrolase
LLVGDIDVTILGAESLGVRGLCCVVKVGDRRVVIDPGLALGYRRHGLLPHPAQVAIGERVRRRIIAALKDATDVVISHLHGDHVPLPDANPYQLKAQQMPPFSHATRFWVKGPEGLSSNMVRRRTALSRVLGRDLPNAEGQSNGPLTLSPSEPHGESHSHLGTVMMTRIEGADTVFVHASDIQLLDRKPVSLILEWQPNIALVGGPPLYLPFLSTRQRGVAWANAQHLACHVDTLILDHHMLRSAQGLTWLDRLSDETDHRVICAADFMEQPRRLLEAKREKLYEEMPVPAGWHEAYARGEADTRAYRDCEAVYSGADHGTAGPR